MLTKPIRRTYVPGVSGREARAAYEDCSGPRPGPPSSGGGSGGGTRTRTRCEQKCTLVGYESGSIAVGGTTAPKPIYFCQQVCYTENY